MPSQTAHRAALLDLGLSEQLSIVVSLGISISTSIIPFSQHFMSPVCLSNACSLRRLPSVSQLNVGYCPTSKGVTERYEGVWRSRFNAAPSARATRVNPVIAYRICSWMLRSSKRATQMRRFAITVAQHVDCRGRFVRERPISCRYPSIVLIYKRSDIILEHTVRSRVGMARCSRVRLGCVNGISDSRGNSVISSSPALAGTRDGSLPTGVSLSLAGAKGTICCDG